MYTNVVAINNLGQVAGNSNKADYSTYLAFLTAPNKPINPATDLIPTAGGTYSNVQTNGLNDSGQLAVRVGLKDGFRYDPDGSMHDLGNLGGLGQTFVWAINASGQVTGQADIDFFDNFCSPVGTLPAFRTGPNSALVSGDNLGTLLNGCRGSIATAINSSGQVVGYSSAVSIFNPEQHAMLVTGTTMQDLGLLGGSATYPAVSGRNAIANAINNAGQIVGASTYNNAPSIYSQHAFLTTSSGPMQDLGTLGGTYSYANGINASGAIVGTATTAGDAANVGFVYVGGTMYDLNTLINSGSGYSVVTAYGINDSGQIVATAELLSDKTYHPVRLDPANIAASILIAQLSDPALGLSAGVAASLTDKLSNTVASIQGGLNKQAINQLNAFVSSVQVGVKTGKISAQSGSTLIANANAIMATL